MKIYFNSIGRVRYCLAKFDNDNHYMTSTTGSYADALAQAVSLYYQNNILGTTSR